MLKSLCFNEIKFIDRKSEMYFSKYLKLRKQGKIFKIEKTGRDLRVAAEI